MDLKKHIGQMTKVKKDLDSMRAARVRHKEAWTRHVQNLVEKYEGTAAAVSVGVANFDACEVELVQSFDAARRAILDITQQTTPAEEDAKAIAELDSALLAGGPGAPIEVEDEGDQRREHGHQHERGHAVTEYFGCVCELFDGVTYSVRSSTVQITKRRWYSQGFLRRGGGVGLTWQSVFTEQDQTRSLRFRDDVEVFEFRVGYDMDHWRYNIYDHYEFYWTTLAVAKPTLGVNSWNGMTTAEALLHCYNHSVRSNDNFLDEWVAIERAQCVTW